MNAPNAKTAAAARKQAPVVANNVLADIGGPRASRIRRLWLLPADGGAGKIVLAEFGYGGKLLPSFPKFLIDGTKPSRAFLAPQGASAAADLLEGDAARQGMDGQARNRRLS
jgi:sulfide:quinone oxidoreductase